MSNTIQYTSRTYATIYADLVTRYPTQNSDFLKMLAGLFDQMHWYLDATANNLSWKNFFTEEAEKLLCDLINYIPNRVAPAGATLRVNFGTNQSYAIPKSDLIFTVVDSAGNASRVASVADLNFTGDTADILVSEGDLFSDINLGEALAGVPYQEFIIYQSNIVWNSVKLQFNGIYWSYIENLVDANPTDQVFTLVPKPDGSLAILTGNGVYGKIPDAYPAIVSYVVSKGSAGNVPLAGHSVIYEGTNSDITTCELVSALRNGADRDSFEKTKFTAPKMLTARYRAVTEVDYVALSLKFSSSIIQARCFPGIFGEESIGVFIIPSGGGTANPVLLNDLQEHLIQKSPTIQRDVRVRSAVYTPVNISSDVKLYPGYSSAVYANYIRLLWDMYVSEVNYELIIAYTQLPIADVVLKINTFLGYSFTSADYPIINMILGKRLQDYRSLSYESKEVQNFFGGKIFPSNLIGGTEYLPGVDYVDNLIPASIVSMGFFNTFTRGAYGVNFL